MKKPKDRLMRPLKNTFLILAMLAGFSLAADDAEANRAAAEAIAAEKAGQYRDAAKLYEEADFYADDPQLKANALKSAVMTYRKAGLLEAEYEAIEKLLTRHAGQTKYPQLIEREFEIGKAFYHGHRDPAFWAFRGIPWLKGPDRTVEILQAALKRAPFADKAPEARLLLVHQLDKNGKLDDTIKELRTLIKDYPESQERRFGMLALGDALYIRSKRGDGDGRFAAESAKVYQDFLNRYPDATERDFVEKSLLRSKDIQAERLLGLARYYKRQNRTDAAERYLNRLIREYPDTESATQAEAMLVHLDETYTPDGFQPEIKPRLQTYDRRAMPADEKKLLLIPENSNGKYLLPIYDVSIPKAPEKEEDNQK